MRTTALRLATQRSALVMCRSNFSMSPMPTLLRWSSERAPPMTSVISLRMAVDMRSTNLSKVQRAHTRAGTPRVASPRPP